jgi:Flp pilus assembly protein TadG
MRNDMRRLKRRRGVAIVEFTLSMIFLIPLLLGTFIFGFRLIRSLSMVQITRDLGHMYVRGINFRNAGPQQNAQTLAQGFDLSVTGTSLVILSRVKVIQQADCDAANAVPPTPLPPGQPCANQNLPVFMEQLTVGNTANGTSSFGTPPLQADKTVSVRDQGRTIGAVAAGFSTAMTLNGGEYAYVAEMVNLTPDLNIPGFSGRPQVYSRSIF